MPRVCVIDLSGLSRELLKAVPENSSLGKWMKSQRVRGLTPTWPALTCSMQATLTTGKAPSQHGIIANGFATYRSKEDQRLIDASNFASYRRDVSFWEQSNQLVQSPRFWQDPTTGKSKWKTAMLFFQNSIPGFVEPLKPAADIVITPKPEHGADGKITSLCWSQPRELVDQMTQQLGPFPLMKYWGPFAGIESSRWIAEAAARIWKDHSPQLQLVYVPHLDYDLQRFGPDSPQSTKAVADVSEAIEPLINAVLSESDEVIVLSEYAMTPVKEFAQPNLLLARAGLLVTRESPDGPLIDYARSAAFAMCDHQIAHVYVRDGVSKESVRADLEDEAIHVLHDLPVDARHRRAGDLILEAPADGWFDYRWWDSPPDAPVFAREVDIHRKPGYDPTELFFDPVARSIKQDPSLVRGSHGLATSGQGVLVGTLPANFDEPDLPATRVAGAITNLLAS